MHHDPLDPPPPPPPPEAFADLPDTSIHRDGASRRDSTSTGAPPPRRLGLAVLIAVLNFVVLAGAMTAVAEQGRPDPVPGPSLGQVADGVAVPAPLNRADVAAASAAAGCELLVDGAPLADRSHLDGGDATPLERLYPDVRPPHSGRHFAELAGLQRAIPDRPYDPRVVLHNLEHGSVVVWFDGASVDATTVARIADWRASRGDQLGFASEARGGVFASPTDEITSGKAIALRAWGVALDCDRFDPLVADAFLVDHWGSNGASPEANLSPYPPDSLRWAEEA